MGAARLSDIEQGAAILHGRDAPSSHLASHRTHPPTLSSLSLSRSLSLALSISLSLSRPRGHPEEGGLESGRESKLRHSLSSAHYASLEMVAELGAPPSPCVVWGMLLFVCLFVCLFVGGL